ncbi:Aldose-ketose isomerase YihS [Cronobacter malonaticus 681]|nr:Aldose-ketose isomerase YihS [Cronobacter malonaticus 681]
MKWFNTLSHHRWLEQETDRIFAFGRNAAVPTGFGWLGNNGQVKEEMGTHLWITARMLHVYAVAALALTHWWSMASTPLTARCVIKNMAAGTPV